MGKPFIRMGKPFSRMGKPFSRMGKPFSHMGKPLSPVLIIYYNNVFHLFFYLLLFSLEKVYLSLRITVWNKRKVYL